MEGFFTLSLGKELYAHFATNLAYSMLDRGSKISVLTDRPERLDPEIFDKIIKVDLGKDWGLAKLKMYEHLPYDFNVFIDADSLAGRSFDPEKCLKDLECDFTCAYNPNDIGIYHKSHWLRGKFMNFDLNKDVPYNLTSAIMAYRKGACEDFHKSAIEWHGKIKRNDFSWYNVIPDELCYVLAYASNDMELVGDKEYYKPFIQNHDAHNKMADFGIKTYSSAANPLPPLCKVNYNVHIKYLSNKFNKHLRYWQDKK